MRTLWAGLLCLCAATCAGAAGEMKTASPAPAATPTPVLKHSDVAFMGAADGAAYKAYGATFVAWGGADTAEKVKRHHDLGIRCTGSMWCLTAGAENLYKDAALRDAVAKDIEGKPIEVPWLFDHVYQGQKTWFGCTNHPAFRAHCEREVRRVMAGGADGLHVDDHLGVAQAATGFGGGLCDYCIAAFREYLKKNATPDQLAKAGVTDIDKFDYRDLIRKHATTRQEYLKVRYQIPLRDLFDRFHLEAAADFVRHLGEVAAQTTGRPVLLSANAWLVDQRHRTVAKYVTHIVCEAEFHADRGTTDLTRAIPNFEQGQALGKPVLVTASGGDFAYVKVNKTEDLVRFWIAVTYAHGQWFMAPHPKKQWCFTKELGTHWYEAPAEAYAPVYQFIRKNAEWFDGFEAVKDSGALAKDAPNVFVLPRRKSAAGPLVVHVVNRDYDAAARTMRPAKGLRVEMPAALLAGLAGRVKVLTYEAEPQTVAVKTEGGRATIILPDVRLWSVLVIE